MRVRSGCSLVRLALVAGLSGAGGGAWALSPGQVDSFENGLAGWSSGANHPAPPRVEQDGGPDGSGDAWFRLSALGGVGAGSRLVAFSGPQWAGNYALAGITSITMDANNLGDSDLALRLLFDGGPTTVTSALAALPAHSGWISVSFALDPALLTSITQFRLVHQPTANGPIPQLAALLGVDNVQASPVPEPASTALMALGLLALAGLHQRRRRHAPTLSLKETQA